MMRAALALYEATGEGALSRRRAALAGRAAARLSRHGDRASRHDGARAPTVSSCARSPPMTTPCRTPTASSPKRSCAWPRSPGTTRTGSFAEDALRPSCGVAARRARRSCLDPQRPRPPSARPEHRRDGRRDAVRCARPRCALPYLDRSVCAPTDAGALGDGHPAHGRRRSPAAEPQALVCAGMRCSLPVTTPEALAGDCVADA